MSTINRYRVIWTGGPGGEGVSTFHSLDTDITALASIRAFFDGIKAFFPSAITWTFPNSGDQLESTSGALVGGWTQPAAAPVAGGGSTANFAAGVGARIVWGTTAIVGGRRVKGGTFLTSLITTCYQSDGTLASAAISAFQTAGDALVAANDTIVWSRPRGGVSGFGTVESCTVPDRVTALRSRRY